MTDKDKEPRVEMMPEVAAKIAADPELKAAMGPVLETLYTAMQGVKEGKYASFPDAMFALTGEYPTRIGDSDVPDDDNTTYIEEINIPTKRDKD